MRRLIPIVVLMTFVTGAQRAAASPAQSGQAIAFAVVNVGNLLNFGGNGTKGASASAVTTGVYNISFQGKYPKNISPHTLVPIVSAFNNGHGEVADVRSITMDPGGFTVQVIVFSSGSELDLDGMVSLSVYYANAVN